MTISFITILLFFVGDTSDFHEEESKLKGHIYGWVLVSLAIIYFVPHLILLGQLQVKILCAYSKRYCGKYLTCKKEEKKSPGA